jgi:hypothetical protein
MQIITGLIYTPFGGEIYGMLFFSAVLGFCGCLYFCLAFSLWTNQTQTRNYARIVLFLPSFALWTGIFGKDSWIALGLGLAAYGYSAKLKGLNTGLVHLIVGLGITTVVRPHISVTFAVAMVVAYFWGLTRRRRVSILTKIQMVVMLVGMLIFLAVVAQKFLGIQDVSADTLEAYGAARANNNALGGSAVEVGAVHSVNGLILQFPRAIVRELFEPFPWEVHNFTLGLAAAENLFLIWFVFGHAKRLRRLFHEVIREPYVLFSFILAGGLLVIFSLTPNLGLLSRERAQLLPFVFAPLVAAEAVRRRNSGAIFPGSPSRMTFEPGPLMPVQIPMQDVERR